MTKLVFGHKNPDTDTICSALVYADLKRELGDDVEARRLGELNKETEYVLNYFGVSAPEILEKVTAEDEVILVDHNEFQQSVDQIGEATIREVVDHHRIANFETKEPVLFRAEPVGCTATIIFKIYQENGLTPSKENAGLLLSAIVSDTLLLKSPTCTVQDVEAAKELASLAEVDLEEYGLAMLKAGADLSDKSVMELITMDAKEFTMGNAKVEIAQINTVDLATIFEQQAEIEAAINEVIAAKELDLFLFVVTDILNNNSEVLALGEGQNKVAAGFDVSLENRRALLKGVVSRKKQIVTTLENQYNNG